MTYAARTTVPVDRSKIDIEQILARYGAERFGYVTDGPTRAAIAFSFKGRSIRMKLDLPKPDDFAKTPTGKTRPAGARATECAQAVKARWRSLLLIVQAKLEAVDAGITTFETEWLPYVVLPNGRTVAETVEPEIQGIIESGRMPRLMLDMDR